MNLLVVSRTASLAKFRANIYIIKSIINSFLLAISSLAFSFLLILSILLTAMRFIQGYFQCISCFLGLSFSGYIFCMMPGLVKEGIN